MKILAIDPGTEKSGWVLYDCENHEVIDKGITENVELKYKCSSIHEEFQEIEVAIERIVSYGMPIGESTIATIQYIGRLQERFEMMQVDVTLIPRKEVKKCVCNNGKAKDANVRQALIDLFPATGGGAKPQIGTKKEPGPLYGMSSHAWAALGVAITHAVKIGQYKNEIY